MALSWWKKGLWQIVHASLDSTWKEEFQKFSWPSAVKKLIPNCHDHWTVHAKERISKLSCWVRGAFFDPKLRNERFTLIFFMGFQICIFNTKNSKLTFSNGPQLMEKHLWQIVMHHWTVHAKEEFQNFLILCHRGFIPHLWS